jgi:16S rRNA (guanine527-N7)-methyltransferase
MHDTQLRDLVQVFLAENEKVNLSALRTEDACWHGNVLDSLALNELPDLTKTVHTFLDVGTGGGFPLLPLAITHPDWTCTGLDSIGKKMLAVQRIADGVHLKNVRTIAERAEVLAHNKDHREHYDLVTSRAVAEMSVLLEYCAAFAKVGGVIVLWKSLHIDDELAASKNAQQVLGCTLESTHRYILPGDWGERQLLMFRKSKALAKEYPRVVGEAKKKPL